jgi:hypothetical protein
MGIGYGMPPVETRFRKGQSGNPGGRPGPRRALEKRFQAALGEALLAEPERLMAGRPASAIHALAEGFVCGAALGEVAALALVLELMPQRGRRPRFAADLRRAMERAIAADADPLAQSQGNSAG